MAAYHMYRNTTIGTTLQETLDEQLQLGHISPALATKVLMQFDKTINNALSTRIKNRMIFKAGHLKTYRFCDNVWTFVLKEVEFKDGSDVVKVDKCKIVACDGKTSGMRGDNE